MNRNLTLLCLFFSFSSIAQSGNFNTLYFEKPQFFAGSSQNNSPFASPSQIKVMYFDDRDTIGVFTEYHGFNSIRGDYNSQACIDTVGKAWFGSFGITDTAGIQVYLNQYNQTIRLETQDTVNQTWTAFYYFNGDILEGKIASVSSGSMFSSTDETKAISFKRKDNNGIIIPDIYNTKEFLISRDSGWISLCNLFSFPDDTSSVNRIPAINSLTKGECFDFNAGDIFQYNQYCNQSSGGPSPGSIIEREILSRVDFPAGDSVVYTALEKIMTLSFSTFPVPHTDTTFSQSQISFSYTDLSQPFFTQWPEEIIYDRQTSPALSGIYSFGLLSPSPYYCETDYSLFFSVGMVTKSDQDSCYPVPFEPVYRNYQFSKGLGRIRLEDDQQAVTGPICGIQLTWYSKNGITCGNRASLVGLNKNSLQSQFTIAPNPVKNELQIHTSQFIIADIYIYSSDGKLQKNKKFSGTDDSFSVNDFPPGVYYIQLCEKNKSAFKKFVVIH